MSIELIVRSIDKTQLQFLRDNPERVTYFLYGPDVRYTIQERAGFIGFIFGDIMSSKNCALFHYLWKRKEIKKINLPADWAPPADEEIIDMDKSYSGLHFAFCGSHDYETDQQPADLKKILLHGNKSCEHIGSKNVLASILTSDKVRMLRSELEKIDEDEIKQRLAKDVEEQHDENDLNYHASYFTKFKALLNRAADNDRALIFHYLV